MYIYLYVSVYIFVCMFDRVYIYIYIIDSIKMSILCFVDVAPPYRLTIIISIMCIQMFPPFSVSDLCSKSFVNVTVLIPPGESEGMVRSVVDLNRFHKPQPNSLSFPP